ncbi:HPP family protein [Phyllobacterium sp. SB3]|uniref:HPP family protein n=1 Tax=Phyllobacterium sp. SB3 TaxID=3156073 RepID=UPI0032AF7C8E
MSSQEKVPGTRSSTMASKLRLKLVVSCVSGLGGLLAVYLLATIAAIWNTPLLIAPFGASCVLIFAIPQSPLAQPHNVIGGHLLSSATGLIALATLGTSPIACGLAVGFAIAAMQFTDTLHPPAGADPIVVILAGASWHFLLTPVLAGTATIIVVATLYHKLLSKRPYPHNP